jgi:hypothetical protein
MELGCRPPLETDILYQMTRSYSLSRRQNFVCLGAFVAAVFWMSACGQDSGTSGSPSADLDPDIPPYTDGAWYRPATSASWQWQLSGDVNTAYGVEIYDIDLFDAPPATIETLHAAGRKVFCYFSAGSSEDWRSDYDQLLASSIGSAYADWDGENWLDIRAQNVLEVMLARLDLAVDKGCDGVEPDNVDGFENVTGFELGASQQLAFNRRLANEAHARGLSVALKNDGRQVGDLIEYFDLAVVESCHESDECADYEAFIAAGKPVLNAEYSGDPILVCPLALARNFRTLFLPLDLDDSSRISCDP